MDKIRDRGHGVTGTVKRNRRENCPIADSKQFKKQTRDTEKHLRVKSSETLVDQWNDNLVVCIASNQPSKSIKVFPSRKEKMCQPP